MNSSSLPQRPRSRSTDSNPYPIKTSSPLLPHTGVDNVKFPMIGGSDAVMPTSDSAHPTEIHSVSRLSIENIHLAHQNGSLARELAHSRYTIHALRQIVSQKENAEQHAQNDLKQSLWRVRVLEAVVSRMSEQLVLLMGEQRGGFEENTDIVGLAREVAVGEFYRQHASLQQRELEAIRGELGARDEDDYDPEEEEEEEEEYDDSQHLTVISTASDFDSDSDPVSPQELTGKVGPSPPLITITDSDAEHLSTFDSDQSFSSSSSDDDSEVSLEEPEDHFATVPIRNLDPTSKKLFEVDPAVIEERPGLRADVLFARMRMVPSEV